MAVKRITHFGAKSVPGPKATGLEAERLAFLLDRIPDVFDELGRSNHLEAIFTRIAGASYPD